MVRDKTFKIPHFFLLALLIFTSCSNEVQDINQQVSSFQNTPVQLVGGIEHNSLWSDSAWNEIPGSALFKFQTCLRDKAINNPVIDESFRITSPLKTQVLKSDINGCLVWNEEIAFTSLEQERLLNYPVEISGLGHYKGNLNFSLALNPWPGAAQPMIFLDNDTAAANAFSIFNINEKLESHGPSERNLIIDQVVFSAKPSAMSGDIKTYPMIVQFNTSLASKGLSGENKANRAITKGRFRAIFKILETPEGTNDSLLVASTEKELSAVSGKISSALEFHVPKEVRFNDRSFTYLEMELVPLNAPNPISTERIQLPNFNLESPSVRVIHRITELTQINQRPLIQTPDPEESEIVGEELQGDDNRGYYIRKVKNISRGSIISNSFNKSSIKTRRAKFTLCLNEETSSEEQIPLSDTEIKIDISFNDGTSDGPDTQRIYKTNEEGCLDTYANITYDKFSLERWIPFNVKVIPLSGIYSKLIKTRQLTVNPWNPEDFGYDTKYETEIPEIVAQAPRLFIGSVDYQKEMMDYSEFRINEFLHMSLRRKYQFSFSPKVQVFHSYKDEAVTESITFGKYQVKVSLFKPLTPEADYFKPSLDNFEFITSTSKEMSILPNGKITDLLSFPFLVSETQELAHKNLAILEISPLEEGSKIRPVKVVFPFFGGNRGAEMPAMIFEKEIEKELRVKIDQTAMHGKHLPTIDVIGDPSVDPMAYFVYNFKKAAEDVNPNVIVKDMKLDDFNKSAAIAGWERIKLPKGKTLKDKIELTGRELRTLVTENASALPKGILGKFCRHFYDLPEIKREARVFQRVDAYDGGENYLDCEKRPNEHFNVTPLTHIRKILSRKVENKKEAYASYVESTRGKVSRGNAFFAAYGDRSSSVSGEREGQSTTESVSYGIEGPGPYYIGYSRGHVKEYATFEQKNRADMEAAFDRFYTQRELSALEFDLLKLKFYAQVRRCVSVVGTKTSSARVHLCEDEDRPKQLEEEWYFIGDTRSRDHGLIADGAFPGLSGFTQVIRGRYNYNRIWNKYKENDIAQVLEEIGDSRGLTYAFKRYLKESTTRTMYENFVDNSHPGIYITPRY